MALIFELDATFDCEMWVFLAGCGMSSIGKSILTSFAKAHSSLFSSKFAFHCSCKSPNVALSFINARPELAISLFQSLPPDDQLCVLHNFLIATTFKDISLVFSFAFLNTVNVDSTSLRIESSSSFVTVLCGEVPLSRVDVRVIDLDARKISKIPHYAALDAIIVAARCKPVLSE